LVNFSRVRLGVGRPQHPSFEVSDWVLTKFSGEEQPILNDLLGRAVEAIETLCSEGLITAQNRCNGKGQKI
jgi:peptidyl-tRNA hydrolase, PTH1 family